MNKNKLNLIGIHKPDKSERKKVKIKLEKTGKLTQYKIIDLSAYEYECKKWNKDGFIVTKILE